MNGKFTDKGNRGAVLFVREGLAVKSFEKLNNIACMEAVWCEISVNRSDKVLIGLVYRSPNSSEENNCELNEMMSSINEENHAYKIIMGDFNYKDIDWKHWTSSMPENHRSHGFIESVRDSFLFQHVAFITRYRDNQRPSTIDLVCSNDELLIENLEHFSPLGVSDHV